MVDLCWPSAQNTVLAKLALEGELFSGQCCGRMWSCLLELLKQQSLCGRAAETCGHIWSPPGLPPIEIWGRYYINGDNILLLAFAAICSTVKIIFILSPRCQVFFTCLHSLYEFEQPLSHEGKRRMACSRAFTSVCSDLVNRRSSDYWSIWHFAFLPVSLSLAPSTFLATYHQDWSYPSLNHLCPVQGLVHPRCIPVVFLVWAEVNKIEKKSANETPAEIIDANKFVVGILVKILGTLKMNQTLTLLQVEY